MRKNLIFAAVVSATLSAWPVLAADAPPRERIHYENYIYCAAYAYESADGMDAAGETGAGADALIAAKDMEAQAAKLAAVLNIPADDMAIYIDDARAELGLKADGLTDQEFEQFDKMLGEHCQGVWLGEPAWLDKELTW